MDKDATKMLKLRNWSKGRQRIEMPGGGGSKKPGPKLGCRVIQEEEEEEEDEDDDDDAEEEESHDEEEESQLY